MNIVIALNRSFLRYGYVLLTSVFENNSMADVTVYVLYRGIMKEEFEPYDDLAAEYGRQVIPIEVGEDMIPSDLPHTAKWPIEIYFRLALADILPQEVERVLYLDTDVIVDGALKELYEVDFGKGDEECVIAGCPDISDGNLSDIQNRLFADMLPDPKFHYINSGVIVLNLKSLRKQYHAKMLIDKISELKEYLTAFDQDLINYVFYGKMALAFWETKKKYQHYFIL